MNHPAFMTIEASGYTESSYPIALSWILLDGSYKSVFIKPEESWQEWDAGIESTIGKSQKDLLDMGESAVDVIQELDLDIEQGIIYVEDMSMMEIWLGALFDSMDRDIPFEIRSIFELFPQLDQDAFDEERRFLVESNNMSMNSSEDQILVMQRIWADFGDHENN